MGFTMACPNFKKGLKMVSRPLGVKKKASYVTFSKGCHKCPQNKTPHIIHLTYEH